MNYKLVLTLAGAALGLAGQAAAQTAPVRLTLREAEDLALRNHPQVAAAQNEVAFAGQQVVEARSAYFPTINADATASEANPRSRIGAGALVDSRMFDREGQGITLSQLITDSGRTRNLVASSRLQQQAAQQNYTATRYDVLLHANQAYQNALQAQALVKVAQETAASRQLLYDQVNALAQNKLKSQLDVSFADVNLSDAKLMLLRAQDGVQQAFAELARAVGSDQVSNYQLVDEPLPPSPAAQPEGLITQAMANRPEVASLRLSRDAAYRFADAEKDLSRPTVSLVAVGGVTPYINTATAGTAAVSNEYQGAAVNVEVPIFNGHLFSARREAARQRALEADQHLRDLQLQVTRDVRVAWASVTTAFQRLDVTAQYVREAALALDLAQGRYNLGLSSIVELTQAQLNVTRAEVENLGAKYDYQSQYAALQYAMGLLR
jgi:outer membrane protein